MVSAWLCMYSFCIYRFSSKICVQKCKCTFSTFKHFCLPYITDLLTMEPLWLSIKINKALKFRNMFWNVFSMKTWGFCFLQNKEIYNYEVKFQTRVQVSIQLRRNNTNGRWNSYSILRLDELTCSWNKIKCGIHVNWNKIPNI